MTPPNLGMDLQAHALKCREVQSMLDVCEGALFAPARHRATIVLMWRCGLRTCEAVGLSVADVDIEGRTLSVRKSKTAAGRRRVGFDERTAAILAQWSSLRAEYANPLSPFLCTRTGRPMPPAAWRASIKLIAEQAGIEQRVHSHALRHTYAAERIREGCSLPALSREMGHASIRSTLAYLRSAWEEEVLEATHARCW